MDFFDLADQEAIGFYLLLREIRFPVFFYRYVTNVAPNLHKIF